MPEGLPAIPALALVGCPELHDRSRQSAIETHPLCLSNWKISRTSGLSRQFVLAAQLERIMQLVDVTVL